MKFHIQSWVRFCVRVLAFALVSSTAALSHATASDSTYAMTSCRFSEFSDQTTCPATGYCLPPKAQTNLEVFTMDSDKLQPRTESAAGMPLSFLCPITHVLSSPTSIAADVVGGATIDTPLSCTLYTVDTSGRMTGSAAGSVSGTAAAIIRNLHISSVGVNDTYMLRCQLPVPKPVLLSRTGWTASASVTGGSDVPANALDGSATSRWSTGVAMANGQWFAIDMKTVHTVWQITLDATGNNSDYPRSFAVQTSTDGNTWTTRFSNVGTAPLLPIALPAQVSTRYLRILQTGSASNWWSIRELNVYAPNTNNLASTLNGYRAEELGNTATNSSAQVIPSTSCTVKGPKTLNAKELRYSYNGATNVSTANLSVECSLPNPDPSDGSRSTFIALHEAKAGGGTTCKQTTRYYDYDSNAAPASLTSTTTAVGDFGYSFVDHTTYGDYVRFGFDCTLTPGSSIRTLSLTWP